ncbi:hypothetical protein [Rugamonas rivuli]|uniref:Uncharacterized protein n=1 Tax=Rugamonas rivuli TaxID=2743358 RepID=A0A843S604_9BURK|nr:hypothetical protein [Rugamonas rivuli]MQA19609.1 hypothetical protein [Rugamonas rivuli]
MNEFQQYYGQQLAPQQLGGLAPQGFFGGLLGAPLGGLIGRGIGGLFGNSRLGNQIGQAAGGIGGAFLPFSVDPVTAAYAQQAQQQQQLQQLQQAQLAPQGWFGNIIKSVAQPLGGAIGGAFGNAGLGNTIGGIASQLGGMLPFAADPLQQAYAQQAAQVQQLQQLQAQGLAPQGWFGNIIKSVGRPLGGMIGGAFGHAGLGNTIGGIASQLGGMLPFSVDPAEQAAALQDVQLQSQGLVPQGYFGNLLRHRANTGIISPPIFSNPIGSPGIGYSSPGIANMLPFAADPVSQAYAQQAQDAQLQQLQGLAPQGWFGNLIKNVAQPLGGAIGGAFGNAGLGNTIGGIASQLGGMLPFAVDPVTAAYAQQQAQLAQLAQQANAGNNALYGGQTLH